MTTQLRGRGRRLASLLLLLAGGLVAIAAAPFLEGLTLAFWTGGILCGFLAALAVLVDMLASEGRADLVTARRVGLWFFVVGIALVILALLARVLIQDVPTLATLPGVGLSGVGAVFFLLGSRNASS